MNECFVPARTDHLQTNTARIAIAKQQGSTPGENMIDIVQESIITFRQAADLLPRRRRGRKVNISTIFRWSKSGLKGQVLESLQIGGGRVTSTEALQRFFGQLSEGTRRKVENSVPGTSSTIHGFRTVSQREKAARDAGRKLAELGA